MKNNLTITWKDEIFPKPKSETFKNIPSLERALLIISRRVKKNILQAVYNGEFLIGAKRTKQSKVITVTEKLPVVAEPKKKPMFSGISKLNPVKFVRNLFTRQKH